MQRKFNKKRFLKKFAAFTTAAMLAVSAAVPAYATDWSRYERLEQPEKSWQFAENELGVVNFTPVWGNKEANIQNMVQYIEEARQKGVKILLFPEMCVTGYVSADDPDSELYKMAVENAEALDGPTAKTFAELSDKYDMWIIYGATQTVEGDSEHAYNSAFACSPKGEVTAYQKITPVEGNWCKPGTTPVLLDTEYGRIGLSICYDTYATPELGRYYAAMGCNILLNPTATSRSYRDLDGDGVTDDRGWEWYYKNRLESNASREGYTVLSANLVGADGPEGIYNFPGGSVILQGTFSGAKYYAGTESTEDTDIITGSAGLLTNTKELKASTGSTCRNSDFNPELYARLYAELAEKQEPGETLSYYSETENGPRAAVVNMPGIWGNKEANKRTMIQYIEEAGEKNVDILVFPETVLTGYEWKKPEDDLFYQETGKAMQVALAETIPGDTTNELSEYAKKYNMYIIFGMTEKEEEPIYDKGVEKVYNSAAILYPDGKIDSYRKIHRAGYEIMWSVCGDTPYMFETEWGKTGIDICRDGHFYPELGRYYAAMGCVLFIHPTATTGNSWYRETRIGSYTDRDGMAAITCNLLGGDGTYIGREKGSIPDMTDPEYWNPDNWTGGVFHSTSLIITKYHNPETGKTGVNPKTGYAIDFNGTGSESEGFAERGTSPVGLEIADMNLLGCGFSIANFNPKLFSKMYDNLAALYREGYEPVYGKDAVPAPVTVKLTKGDEPETPEPEKITTEPESEKKPESGTVTVPETEISIPSASVEKKETETVGKAPETGDSAYITVFAFIMAAAGAVFTGTRRYNKAK